ncbi:MAG: hypothetical protein Kow0074_23130 [Candidatus Zixiibacteriota bacterium]
MSPRFEEFKRELDAQKGDDLFGLDLFDDVAHLLEVIPDRTKFLQGLLQIARRVFMADHGAIVSYHNSSDTWFVESSYGFEADPIAEEEVKQYSRTVVRETYEKGASVLIDDTEHSELARRSPSIRRYNIKSVLTAPFFDNRGTALGVIYLDSVAIPGAFDEAARSRLTKLARFCGLAVQRCGELGRLTIPSVLPASKDVRSEGLFEFRSEAMRTVMKYLEHAIQTDAPILLLGENGVGKDYLARWVHDASQRRSAPFVEINLPELAPQMLESELFGIEANSATGVEGSDGLIRLAEGGTVFLNEIAELSLQSQATLLRTIESRSIRRIRGREAFPVNVRFISATNQDLQALMRQERFRRDLYYRINLNEVTIPPLRDRPEDIEPLAMFIIRRKCARMNRPVMRLPKTVLRQMEQMPWPGNIRELSNVIERVVASHKGDEFPRLNDDGSFVPSTQPSRKRMHGRSLKEQVHEFEREIIEATLRDVGGVQIRAARLLRLSEASLRDKMKRLGIQRPKKMK